MKVDPKIGVHRIIMAYEGNPGTGKSRLAEALSTVAGRDHIK